MFFHLVDVTHTVYRFMPLTKADIDRTDLAPVEISKCVKFEEPCRARAEKTFPVGP